MNKYIKSAIEKNTYATEWEKIEKNKKIPSVYKKIKFVEYKEISVNDLLRTLVEITAAKIAEYFEYCDNPDEIIFHGGGILNKTLMESITKNIKKNIKTTDHIVPSKYMECSAFAYLAFMDKGVLFK